MVAGNNKPTTPPPPPPFSTTSTAAAESASASASSASASIQQLNKRYEGLLMVRNKAVRGKGAWYWAHLEPLLTLNPDTGFPKAVKLKCRLCDSLFSASNPSRTASEHLKRGTCPNFTAVTTTNVAAVGGGGNSPSTSSSPRPISSLSPTSAANTTVAGFSIPLVDFPSNQRKRGSGSTGRDGGGGGAVTHTWSSSYQTVSHLSMIEPPPPQPPPPQPPPTTPRYTQETSYSSASPSPVASMSATIPAGTSSSSLFPFHHHTQQQQQQQQQQPPHFTLSGGKDDIASLAMLTDNVKRLKSSTTPKPPSLTPPPLLTKQQIDYSLECLSDWVYSYCGTIPFTSLTHPKFTSFLNQLGLPSISLHQLFSNQKLDTKYTEIKTNTELKIRDAMFFQLSSNGWKTNNHNNLVTMTVNLPNGTSVFRRSVFRPQQQKLPSSYAEEVLLETIEDVCSVVSNDEDCRWRCVGIVADKYKKKALRNLENRYQWMVNLTCQVQGIYSLIKDFYRELPLFRNVERNCTKLATFVNHDTELRNRFRKYRLQIYGHSSLLKLPEEGCSSSSSSSTTTTTTRRKTGEEEMYSVFAMFEDIMSSSRALHQLLTVVDQHSSTDYREFTEMIRDTSTFWKDLEAVQSIINIIKQTAEEINIDHPRISQCLPIWFNLRTKIKDWCISHGIEVISVSNLVNRRFEKNYHPAWSAAYILDPVHLLPDSTNKYLPPFKHLTTQQERDVDKLVTRLVSSPEETHVVLMELMKWRIEGLDPDYAQAVQMKRMDPVTKKMKDAIPQSGRLVWETYLTEMGTLGKVATRLLFLHACSSGVKFGSGGGDVSLLRYGVDRAEKMVFIAGNWKLERKEYGDYDDDKDVEFLNQVFVDDDDAL